MRPDATSFGLLCLVEIAVGVALLALHKLAPDPASAWLSRGAGRAGAAAVAIGLVAAAFVVARWLRRPAGRRRIAFTAFLNLAALALALGGSELALRAVAREVRGKTLVADLDLLPYSWDRLGAYWRAAIHEAESTETRATARAIPDPDLGWRVAPGRASADGMYQTSAEGLRCARAGEVLGPPERERTRVVLVGDSYTYGSEVRFEDTWGHRLDELLGPDVDVVNFGNDAYGVDQAFLRYRHDARPWRPTVAVLAFIAHDLYRSMVVYTPLAFPAWSSPFAKPRFDLADGRLELVMPRAPSPSEIFAHDSIEDLPGLAYETTYHPREWRARWFHASILVRFLQTCFPAWTDEAPDERFDGVWELNAAILREFRALAESEGVVPLVVYLPSAGAGDFGEDRRRDPLDVPSRLRTSTIPFIDLTDDIRAIPPAERRVGKGHYSPRANDAVARRLAPLVREILDGR